MSKHALTALFLLALPLTCRAQLSAGGTPPSFDLDLRGTPPTVALPAVDHAALLAEDAGADKDQPFRFGAPQDLRLDLLGLGVCDTLADGTRLWRLRLSSPGAHSLNLLYDEFDLPPGARLFLYGDDRSQVLGAFTDFNHNPDGQFATQPLAGDALTLEYAEPADAAFPGRVGISRVVHAYRNVFGLAAERDYGDSGACNNNVACPEGDPWRTEIRSVVMILTGGGFRICTGALVNNTAQDMRRYLLTANHCLGGETSWIFMFNYQSVGCSNQNGPTNHSVQGCVRRATLADSDFALLELNNAIPASYQPVWAGWSAVDEAATQGVCIHHPSGDIKKISFENQALISDRYLGNSGVTGSHWKVADWDDGTTEGGSSGSPIFDQNHRVVGQLHGGYASCSSQTSDWYGKFSMSWNRGSTAATRLRDWLDPGNTGLLTLDALDPEAVPLPASATLSYLPGTNRLQLDWTATLNTTSWRVEGAAAVGGPWTPLLEVTEPGVTLVADTAPAFLRVISIRQ
ncbi:MAG: serine protease [Candidatus Delongbacteria bacterium]